ncbi:hypothetical protein AAFG13_06675 [Bradyrhizobium sp. B124]
MTSGINRHWVSLALVAAAAVIGCSGHDGWGWCLFIVFLIEGT